MITVNFKEIDAVEDASLKYAVIVSKYKNQWVFCKHKDRNTWEVPGGHREPNEDILATAKRELWEETGAKIYSLTPICVYSIQSSSGNTFQEGDGLLCFADIETFSPLPQSEIELIDFFEEVPTELTYPQVHPFLFKKVQNSLKSQLISK